MGYLAGLNDVIGCGFRRQGIESRILEAVFWCGDSAMQIRDTGLRFSPVTIILHWIAAAMVVTLLWFGLTAGRLDVGAEKGKT